MILYADASVSIMTSFGEAQPEKEWELIFTHSALVARMFNG